MGRMPPVPNNRRFPRETPAAISSRRQSRLFGFDSIPRNHAEQTETGRASTCDFARAPTREGGPKPSQSGMLRSQYGKRPGIVPAPIAFYVGMLSSISAFPCIDTLQFVVTFPRTGASSHIGTSPAPPSGYTPMVPIRSSSDAVSIHQTPELSCVNVSSTWCSAASASRVTSRKIWPPCL